MSKPLPTLHPFDVPAWLDTQGGRFTAVAKRSKKPIGEGWQHRPYTAAQIQNHVMNGGNVGLLVGDPSGGIGILDLDHNFPAFLDVFPQFKTMPRIVRPDAPQRGKILIKIGDDLPPPRKWKPDAAQAPHCEWLSTGNHALIPPSRHPTGARFALLHHTQPIPVLTREEFEAIWSQWCQSGEGRAERGENDPTTTVGAGQPYADSWNGTPLTHPPSDDGAPNGNGGTHPTTNTAVHASRITHQDTAALKEEIRRRFNMVTYALQKTGGTAVKEGNEVRIIGQGGLLIKPAQGVWNTFIDGQGKIGGDCFNLVAFFTFRQTHVTGEAWRRVFHLAAEFAGVKDEVGAGQPYADSSNGTPLTRPPAADAINTIEIEPVTRPLLDNATHGNGTHPLTAFASQKGEYDPPSNAIVVHASRITHQEPCPMFPETCHLYAKVCKGDPDNCTLSPETLHHALQRQQEREQKAVAVHASRITHQEVVLSTLHSPLSPLYFVTDVWKHQSGLEPAWGGWMLIGNLTLIGGIPNVGKSPLLLSIVAGYLRGEWPDGTPVPDSLAGRGVVYCLPEGYAEQTLLLEKWGVPSSVLSFQMAIPTMTLPHAPDQPQFAFKLDTAEGVAVLEQYCAAMNPGLIVIDGLRAAMSGEESSSTDSDRFLAPLVRLAQQYKAVVVITHHLTKGAETLSRNGTVPSIDWFRGSGHITAAVRSAWIVDQPNAAQPDLRRITLVKAAAGPKGETMGFSMRDPADGLTFHKDAPTAAPLSKKDEAKRFIVEALREGKSTYEQLWERAQIECAAMTEHTLREARVELSKAGIICALIEGKTARSWVLSSDATNVA